MCQETLYLTDRAGFRWHSDVEAAHGTREGGAGGSAAPAGAHEAGARPSEKNARKAVGGVRDPQNQLYLRTIIGISVQLI